MWCILTLPITFIPFSEGLIEYIYKLTQGNPSDIIYRSDHVLDYGISIKAKLLDENCAKEAFIKRGFSY